MVQTERNEEDKVLKQQRCRIFHVKTRVGSSQFSSKLEKATSSCSNTVKTA